MQGDTRDSLERGHVYISGRVQGVSFRNAARREAERLDLAGWVANLPDGRVEAAFEGDPASVREMIQWCETGPSPASVESVDASYEEPQGESGGLKVL